MTRLSLWIVLNVLAPCLVFLLKLQVGASLCALVLLP